MRYLRPALLALAALSLIVGAMILRSHRNQPKSVYSLAEYDAYTAAQADTNPISKVKLLEQFAHRYPKSALLPFVYRDAYVASYAQKSYPKTIQYADKFVALTDNHDQNTRLEALVYRASAFLCDDSTFPTPEAGAKAKDAAIHGVQIVGQLPKPQAMTDEQFASMKENMSIPFDSVMRVADSGLKGRKEACMALPFLLGPASTPPDGRVNRILSEIDNRLVK
jgi:hypothetical protein